MIEAGRRREERREKESIEIRTSLRSLTDWYSWIERARLPEMDLALGATDRRVRENMVGLVGMGGR